MSFSGKFEVIPQRRLAGTPLYSFELKNTSWFGSATFDCMISDERGLSPYYFRDVKLKAGKRLRFDFDTENWTWYNHDFFAILGKNDKILQKWELNLKEYGPGECPECHGTHQCRKCHGKGFIYPLGHPEKYQTCEACGGTGTCQKCDIPVRQYPSGGGPTGIGNGY